MGATGSLIPVVPGMPTATVSRVSVVSPPEFWTRAWLGKQLGFARIFLKMPRRQTGSLSSGVTPVQHGRRTEPARLLRIPNGDPAWM